RPPHAALERALDRRTRRTRGAARRRRTARGAGAAHARLRAARAGAAPRARGASVSRSLREIGLAESAVVLEIGELDPDADARARGLWRADALVRDYREARRELERSSERLPGLPEADAMTESFLIGGRVVQQLVLDPLLPAPLVDERERLALLESMRAYDRLGREAWAGFLGRFGVPHRTAPADTRWAAEGFAQTACRDRRESHERSRTSGILMGALR